MAKILINIPDLKKENGGVYQYSIALLKILAEGNLCHDFLIFCHNPDPSTIELVKNCPNFNFSKSPISTYSEGKLFYFKIFNSLFRKLKFKKRFHKVDIYDWLIKEYKIQIIHTPHQSNVKKSSVKSITTLHDVQELHFPEFFTSGQRAYRAVHYKKAIDEADALIVSYDHVKKDIIKYFSKPENKVHTVLLDMQKLWFENIRDSSSSSIKEKYNLPSNFLLYPASSWEHKNHLKLIEAIKYLNDPEIHLICTGHPTEHHKNIIKPFIEDQNLTDQIKFLGIVADEELFELYQRCRAVVIPTLYEAGSFPLMESILLEIPVICSNVTSLPETIGDKDFVFDPLSVKEMAKKIEKILYDEAFRRKNKAILRTQAERLKNNSAALKINKIYEKLLES